MGQVRARVDALDRMAELVDVAARPGGVRGLHEREDAGLPALVERGLVLLTLDRAEALLSTQIVDAVQRVLRLDLCASPRPGW